MLFAVHALLFTAPVSAAMGTVDLQAGNASYLLTGCFDALEDPGYQYDIEQMDIPAIAAKFHPAAVRGSLNFGYSSAAYWLRCQVNSANAGQWLLEIGYPSLDNVQMFTPVGNGQYVKQEAGDLKPFSARGYPHRNFIFPLTVRPGSQVFYLRVRSEGTLTIPAKLWRPDAFYLQDNITYAIIASYYGLIVALGLYNLLLFFSLRERVYLEYVLMVAGMAIGQASLNGFGNQFVWPESPAWGNASQPMGFAICGLFGSLFTRSFLATEIRVPWIDKIYWGIITGFLLLIPLPFVSYHWAAMLTSLGGLGFSIFTCGVGFYCLRRQFAGAGYFVLAWTLLLAGVAGMAARNFGWLPTNFFTLYGMQIGSSMEMLLLSFALAERIRTMRREKDLAQADALVSRQQLVDNLQHSERLLGKRVSERTRQLTEAKKLLETALMQEQENRETQAHFLGLMAHEIRSPIAVIGNTAQMLHVLVQPDQPEWKARVEKILGAVRRLSTLMDQLLTEERLSVMNHGLERQLGNLDQFCQELATSFSEAYDRKVIYETNGENISLFADWQLIGIAIGNLIDNAAKYSPADTVIQLKIEQEDAAMLCIAVTDVGAGIAPELQPRIFEKFMRGENESRLPGVGLGLYLVNWIAEFHGGFADVDSVLGQGSCFRIHLPASLDGIPANAVNGSYPER